MNNQIYFFAKIHFTRPSQTSSFFGRLRKELDYCHFPHLVLAKDIYEAREKAKAFGEAFFKDLEGGKFTFADVRETII